MFVVAFTTLGLTRLSTDTTVGAFLPTSDPALRGLNQTAQAFGGDPIVIVAESTQPHALLGPDQLPDLIHLEATLEHLPDVAVVYGPGTVVNQIATTARNMLATLAGTRESLQRTAEDNARASGASPQAVAAAGTAATADFDQRYSSLLVQGLPAGLPSTRNPQFVNTIVFDNSGEPRPQWRFVVPTPNAVTILVRPREGLDQAGTQRLVAAAKTSVEGAHLPTTRVTVSGSPAVASALGEAVARDIPLVGGIALVLISGCYLLIPWTRKRSRRLLPLFSTLIATLLTLSAFGWLGVPLSLGVVPFLPIVIGIGSDFPAYLVHGGTSVRRIVIVALASAAGFATLALSPLPFVRDLGLALAAGVLAAVAVAAILRNLVPVRPGTGMHTELPAQRTPWSRNRRVSALTAAIVVAALGWILLPQVTIDASPEHLAAGLPAIADAQHTESLLGSSGEVDVTLAGPNVATPEALTWMRKAEDAVVTSYGDRLRPIVSLPDLLQFLGTDPSPSQYEAALNLLPHYLTAAVMNDDHTQAEVSFGLALQDLGAQRQLLDALRAALPPPPAGTTSNVVGVPVVAAHAFQLVSQGRYLTNLAGILAAGLILLIGFRQRSIAARAVLAAAIATGWSLAGSWLFGFSLSPLTVALGSLTTATACEFTVVLSYGGDRTTTRLGRTVGVAALAASLGYLALTISRLAVIRDFGFLLAGTVVLSLLAALLIVRTLPTPHRQASWSTGSSAAEPVDETAVCRPIGPASAPHRN